MIQDPSKPTKNLPLPGVSNLKALGARSKILAGWVNLWRCGALQMLDGWKTYPPQKKTWNSDWKNLIQLLWYQVWYHKFRNVGSSINCEGYASADLSLWTRNWLEQLTSSICSLKLSKLLGGFNLTWSVLKKQLICFIYIDVGCETDCSTYKWYL